MPSDSLNALPDMTSILEEQLSSVIEQEGISILAADGVRLMAAPTLVEVQKTGKSSKRRRSRGGYGNRPAVSVMDDERLRDAVADLDRVVVGFADSAQPRIIRKSVLVRMTEHERSPYVVSLRGVSFEPVRIEEERIRMSDALAHELPVSRVPDLDAVTALAADLSEDASPDMGEEQFTSAAFEQTYVESYGMPARAKSSVASFFSSLVAGFTNLFTPRARKEEQTEMETDVVVTSDGRVWAFTHPRVVRAAMAVGGLLFVATMPANAVRMMRSLEEGKAAVTAAGVAGIAEAKAAGGAPLSEGVDALRRASARFREADAVLGSTNALAVGLAALAPQTHTAFATARALTEIGAKTSDAGSLLAVGLAKALGPDASSPLDRLKILSAYAEGALPLLDDAASALKNVDAKVLPEAERDKLEELTIGIDAGRVAVREFTGIAELLASALGREEPRRYLLIFQNPAELRATGGFMGSFAEVTVDKGELTKLDVPPGGTYAVQGQLTARVMPPQPLQLISDRWEFQDSNWSPDFQVAAEKIKYFWSKSGGPTMDGIIAVNATLVQKLLTLTGPIDVPELGKTITADNFMLEVQKSVEIEYDRTENQPKKILGLMAPRLMEKLKALPQEKTTDVLAILSSALETKEIQVAFANADEEALAKRFGWAGQMKNAPGDALALIGTNIAGQKTDLSVNETVDHLAVISADGGIQDTVTLTREHTAGKGELFRGVRNVSYLRFYVPRGASLVSASGFTPPDAGLFKAPQDGLATDPNEAVLAATRRHDGTTGLDVWDEGDRTVFGGWSMVDPGQTVKLSVVYRLPFSAFDLRDRLQTGPQDAAQESERAAYSLLLTSQSGKANRQIRSHVTVPETWNMAWGRAADGIEGVWDRDAVAAALYDVE
jgi:hypothetical protein